MINIYDFINKNITIIGYARNDNPIEIGNIIGISQSETEKFIVICYKNNDCVGICLMSNGNSYNSEVPFDKITNTIFLLDANAFKILHNHPSGIIRPSKDDKKINKKCKILSDSYNVKFLESIIISGNKWYECLSKKEFICKEE